MQSRSDIFITSKVSPYEQGTEKATAACEAILDRLKLDSVDLMLVHWPGVAKQDAASPLNAALRRETWLVLESFHRRGLFKALGVSNYGITHIEELLEYAQVPPSCVQVECHPLYPQPALREFCSTRGISFVAYSPFGVGQLLTNPKVMQVAASIDKSPAQTLLCWGLAKGCVVIPKSIKEERIAEFSPRHPALQEKDWDGSGVVRYLSVAAERALDEMGADEKDWVKYCWDPTSIA